MELQLCLLDSSWERASFKPTFVLGNRATCISRRRRRRRRRPCSSRTRGAKGSCSRTTASAANTSSFAVRARAEESENVAGPRLTHSMVAFPCPRRHAHLSHADPQDRQGQRAPQGADHLQAQREPHGDRRALEAVSLLSRTSPWRPSGQSSGRPSRQSSGRPCVFGRRFAVVHRLLQPLRALPPRPYTLSCPARVRPRARPSPGLPYPPSPGLQSPPRPRPASRPLTL